MRRGVFPFTEIKLGKSETEQRRGEEEYEDKLERREDEEKREEKKKRNTIQEDGLIKQEKAKTENRVKETRKRVRD